MKRCLAADVNQQSIVLSASCVLDHVFAGSLQVAAS
jgi:hypothetical protein